MSKFVVNRPMGLDDFRASLGRRADSLPRLGHNYFVACQSKWFKQAGYVLDHYPTELLSWMEEEADKAHFPSERGFRLDSHYVIQDDSLGYLCRLEGYAITARFSRTKEPVAEVRSRDKLIKMTRTCLDIKSLDDKVTFESWLRIGDDSQRDWRQIHHQVANTDDFYPQGSHIHIS